jgi:hypothetical protein
MLHVVFHNSLLYHLYYYFQLVPKILEQTSTNQEPQ